MRRILVPIALSLILGGASAALASPAVSVAFVRYYDDNFTKSFVCGDRFDVLVSFKDQLPAANAGSYHGHLRIPVNPLRNVYRAFQLAPSDACYVLDVVSGGSFTDPFLDLEFNCSTSGPLDLNVVVTDAYTGPTIPIYFEATASVDETQSLKHYDLDTPFYYSEAEVCTQPDLALAKSDGGITSAPGKTIPYTLTTSNIGQGTANSAQLTETVPANTTFSPTASSPGWTCTPDTSAGSACTLALGNVVAGASLARVFAVTVGLNLAPSVTLISNTASVSSKTTDSNPSNNTASDTTPLTPGIPDLSVVKTTSSTGANPGSFVTWTLTVANSGNAQAANVTLNETLPSGTTFASSLSSPGWTCNGSGSCTSSLGTVLAGTSTSRQFAVQVANPVPQTVTSLQNTACASTTSTETNTANNCGSTSTPVGGSPILQVQKFVESGSGTPGSVIVWGVTLTNTGNRDAGAVTVQETVPQGTTFSPTGSSSGWTCSPSNAPGSICTLTLPSLAGGGSSTSNFATRVANPLPAGQALVANTVCAATAGAPYACATVVVPSDGSPNLAVMKSLTSGDSSPGSTDVFTISIQNTGNQDATSVPLTETVPPNTTFAAAQSSPDWSCAGSTAGSQCFLTIPTLAGAGATTTRLFAVTVVSPLPAGVTSLTNTACVGQGAALARRRRTKANGGACDTITVTTNAAPVLRISKTLSSGTVSSGQVLTYALAISNTGNQDASGVTVTDTLPPGSTWTGGSQGWLCQPSTRSPSTCSLNLGALAAGAAVNLTLTVQLDSPLPAGSTTLTNQACATDGSRQACDQVTDPILPSGAPALAIKKTYTDGPLRPGATLAFHLHVANSGTATANAVRVTETVPTLTTFSASSSGPGWNCPSGSAGSSCTLDLTPLAAGASTAVVAPDPLPPNVAQIANTACVQDGTGQTVGCDEASTPLDVVLYLSLRDSLQIDLGHDGNLSPGDTLRYTLLVTNTSDRPATSAVITTAIDPHLQLVVGSVTTDAGSVAIGNSSGDSSPRILIPTLLPAPLQPSFSMSSP
jgi:uncharacterized repeat protein (TIGR01451 family)